MIISRTPYRISFAGGLSDLEDYYKYKDGKVISTTIDKHIYIIIVKSYRGKYRAVYRQVEEVDNIEDFKHELIRECLKYVNITEPIEIISIGDIIGGSGLGSSSAFTVGLLNSLYAYKGIPVTKYKLAKDACDIEINILHEPIGRQDQYIAAFGGLNKLIFNKKRVTIHPIPMDSSNYQQLQNNLMLFHTGITRKSKIILEDQRKSFEKIRNTITKLCYIAEDMYDDLLDGNIDKMGSYLKEEWELKKTTGNISNTYIDNILDRGINAGAISGKICGAGLGGFILFYCDVDKQNSVREELKEFLELPFKFEEGGSRIIYKQL